MERKPHCSVRCTVVLSYLITETTENERTIHIQISEKKTLLLLITWLESSTVTFSHLLLQDRGQAVSILVFFFY